MTPRKVPSVAANGRAVPPLSARSRPTKSRAADWKAPEPFQNKADVEHYFAGDRLMCLMCGKSYVTLPPHLKASHGLSSDDYKVQFGIPFSFGLAGSSFRERSAARMMDLQSRGVIQKAEPGVYLPWLRDSHRRPNVPSVRRANLDKLITLAGGKAPIAHSIFETFLERVSSGRMVLDVARDPDMPSAAAFYRYMNSQPDFKRRYEASRDQLPIDVRVKIRTAKSEHYAAIAELRRKGQTWLQISQELGIKPSTLRNTWKRIPQNLK